MGPASRWLAGGREMIDKWAGIGYYIKNNCCGPGQGAAGAVMKQRRKGFVRKWPA